MPIQHWTGRELRFVRSRGGVWALCNVWDNFIQGSTLIWPPPELIQKLYASRQAQAFDESERAAVEANLGYYCDLQSIHSEDAVTWNLFGPLVYAAAEVRSGFARELLTLVGVPSASPDEAVVWLWRRIPHPDSNGLGGPEIDFGLMTADTLVLGEAKWRSGVGQKQGIAQDKDQVQLRQEFCQKLGHRLLPGINHLVILGVSPAGGVVAPQDIPLKRGRLYQRDTTWEQLASLPSLSHGEEFRQQLAWRMKLTQS